MSRLTAKLFAGIIGTALVISVAFKPIPAEAASMTKAEKVAWKQANVACKAEARGKKLGWIAGRKFVKGCLIEALKDHPNIDVNKLMKDADVKRLPVTVIDRYN